MKSKDDLPNMHADASARIFQLAEKLRHNMTLPEKKLWEFLRLKPEGYKFRRQHPFARYILDFYCHKKRLSIEIDGENHNSIEHKENDSHRTELLKGLGVKEIRFTNSEVLHNFQSVTDFIIEELREASL
jgi:very-short-patch-repair endonuclease